MLDIATTLKYIREDKDLTQIEVMQQTGINNKTLSGYENGVSEPDINTLIKLFSFYNVSADSVFNLHTDNNESLCSSCDELKLLRLFRSLPDEYKNIFLLQLETVCNATNK